MKHHEPGRDGSGTITHDGRIQPTKDDIALPELPRLTSLHHEPCVFLRQRLRLLPRRDIPVPLAGRARGGADGVEVEVGVFDEEEHEALPDGASAS